MNHKENRVASNCILISSVLLYSWCFATTSPGTAFAVESTVSKTLTVNAPPTQAGGTFTVRVRGRAPSGSGSIAKDITVTIGQNQTAAQKLTAIKTQLTNATMTCISANNPTNCGRLRGGNPDAAQVTITMPTATSVTVTRVNMGLIREVALKGKVDKNDTWTSLAVTAEEFEDERGIYSLLNGFPATGLAEDGTPGFVAVSVGGQTFQVDTTAGVDPIDVEDALLTALTTNGFTAGLANASFLSFADLNDDGRVLVIRGLDATGFSVVLEDTGLDIDTAGLFTIPEPATLTLLALGGLMLNRRRQQTR